MTLLSILPATQEEVRTTSLRSRIDYGLLRIHREQDAY